jgi:hypothetical protein
MTRPLSRDLQRAVLSRYPGVDAVDVARIEGIEPGQVRQLRERHRRAGDDGLPGHINQLIDAAWARERELADIERLMRTNRSARA